MLGKRLSVAKLTPLEWLRTSRNETEVEARLARRHHHLGRRGQADAVEEVVEQLGRVPCAALAHVDHARAEGREQRPDRVDGLRFPPAITVSVPFSAAAAPPEIPASTKSTPTPRAERGARPSRSARSCSGRRRPGRARNAGSSARTTGSTTVLSGSDSRTTSTAPARLAGEAPADTQRRARVGVEVEAAAISYPRLRCACAIRPPMFPSPMIPHVRTSGLDDIGRAYRTLVIRSNEVRRSGSARGARRRREQQQGVSSGTRRTRQAPR